MNTDKDGSVFICTTNVRILLRRSRIFSPRRREEREEKRFQKLRVLRGGFFGLRLGCSVFIGGFKIVLV